MQGILQSARSLSEAWLCCLELFVVWAIIPTSAVLLVAMVTVHLPYGFSSVKLLGVSASGAQFGPVGYELSLLYLAALITLAFQGPGPVSIDHLRQRRSTH
jgi:putative oxidoreductase